MAKVYEFLATGFEDIEALTTVDVLRRAGHEVVTLSISDEREVVSAHGVTILADGLLADADLSDADLLLLPGGMPGSSNLNESAEVHQALEAHAARRGYIGAICAAPMVLVSAGLLDGRRATCYPGFENYFPAMSIYTGEVVCHDGNIITANGPAAALPYAYTLLARLTNDETAQAIAEGMRYVHLMER